MLNFNNTLTSKIIALAIVVVFFKSTANQSYLVKLKSWKAKGLEETQFSSQVPTDELSQLSSYTQWIKVSELKLAMEIGTLQEEGLAFYSQGSMPLFADTHFAASDDSKRPLKNLRVIPSEEGKNCGGSFFNSFRLDFNQDYPRIGAGRETKDITEIIVKGQKDTVFSDTELDNFFISHAGKAAFQNRINFITGSPQRSYGCDKEAFIGKKFHLGSLLNENVFIFDYPDGVMDRCLNIFAGKLGITIGKDALNGIARFQKLQEHIHRDTGSFDAGFAKTNCRVNRNSFHQIIRHFVYLQQQLYHNLINASSFIPFAYVQLAGLEQVYDIEAEGGRNFIGNGIFAHNMAMGPYIYNESLRLC